MSERRKELIAEILDLEKKKAELHVEIEAYLSQARAKAEAEAKRIIEEAKKDCEPIMADALGRARALEAQGSASLDAAKERVAALDRSVKEGEARIAKASALCAGYEARAVKANEDVTRARDAVARAESEFKALKDAARAWAAA